MTEHLSHEGYVLAQRLRAAKLAKEALADRLSVVEAARLIIRGVGLDLAPDDPDYQALSLVEDETESLPIGSERENWQMEALAGKTEEITKAEEWARKVALDALRNIAARFAAA